MYKPSYLHLILFIQLALTISCKECHNSDDWDSIFDRLQKREIHAKRPPSFHPKQRKRHKPSKLQKYLRRISQGGKIDVDGIKRLLKERPNILTMQGDHGRNILHEAIHEKADFEAVKYLVEQLEKGYPAQVKNMINKKESHSGATPFVYAVQEKDIRLTQFLLDQGAKPTEKELEKAFTSAINTTNSSEIFEYLLNKGTSYRLDSFILDSIAKAGKADLMEYFLDKNKVDINNKNQNGNTVLHETILSQNHNEHTVNTLLEKGHIDIDTKNNNGDSALHLAIQQASLGIVRTLLRHGADPTLRDGNGKAPIELAEEKLRKHEESKIENWQPRGIVGTLRSILGIKELENKKPTTSTTLDSID